MRNNEIRYERKWELSNFDVNSIILKFIEVILILAKIFKDLLIQFISMTKIKFNISKSWWTKWKN